MQDFNVISFGDFRAFRGDVEGRLAVHGDVFIDPDGFTIGNELRTNVSYCEDSRRPYSLVLGGDSLCWSHGQLFPLGNSQSFGSAQEGIFAPEEIQVSDCFPVHLAARQTGDCNNTASGDCIEPAFAAMQSYYLGLLATWCQASNINTRWVREYDVGLQIKSLDTTATTLYAAVPATVLNSITYYNLVNVRPDQRLIILVEEEDGDCDADIPTFGWGAPIPPRRADRLCFLRQRHWLRAGHHSPCGG